MVFREVFETQDSRRMCKHAERDHEGKKLIALMERLNRKMAEQNKGGGGNLHKPPSTVLATAGVARQFSGFSVFER